MRLKPGHYLMVFIGVIGMLLAISQPKSSASVSASGAYIVYTSGVFNGIFIVRPDGTELRKIELPNIYVKSADCYSVKQQLLIGSGTAPELYTLNFDGSNLKKIPTPENYSIGTIRDVAYAPDGQRVIYSNEIIYYFYPDPEIEDRLIIADLQQQTRQILLSARETNYYDPQWSRDGRQIVYSYREGEDKTVRYGIGVVAADGRINHRILNSTNWIGNPDWSPDGQTIVFSMREGKHFHLFTMRADGTNLVQITLGDHNNTHPRWSPDGRWISFSSTRYGKKGYQIFVMAADTKAVQQVNEADGDNYNQCWM